MRAFFVFIAMSVVTLTANATDKLSKKEQRQLYCLAQNIYFEARGEDAAGQLAVAMVTMNRVFSKRFPSTICGVVWQNKQFSWTHDGKSDRPKEKKAWEHAKQVARTVFSKYHKYNLLSKGAFDITRGALHYYAPDLVAPRWADSKVVTRQIGGHLFLKENS